LAYDNQNGIKHGPLSRRENKKKLRTKVKHKQKKNY
jgi:hypothetical protein